MNAPKDADKLSIEIARLASELTRANEELSQIKVEANSRRDALMVELNLKNPRFMLKRLLHRGSSTRH